MSKATDAIEWANLAVEALIDSEAPFLLNELRAVHIDAALRRLRKAIALIEEAPHVATPARPDPNSGRPSLEEPAALSPIFQNFGE